MITEIQFKDPDRYEDISMVKLEKSKGVRKCKSCGADIFPEVLCVRLHRLVPCNFKTRLGKTVFEPGVVALKENYCVMCAGPIMEIILDMCPENKQHISKNSKYQILREKELTCH